MSTKPNDLSAHTLLRRLVDRWWWALVSGFIGAVIALGISFLLTPRYEATATIALSIDYSRTNHLDLVVEDRVLDRVWVLFTAPETMAQTQALLQSRFGSDPSWLDVQTLQDHLRLDGYFSRWLFIGIDPEPEKAVAIANAWREIALSRLDQAIGHAWQAAALQGGAFEVICVEVLPAGTLDSLWDCISYGPEVSQAEIEALRAEIEASHGILPTLTYEPLQPASLPVEAVLWRRGLLVLSGGMLGLVVGVTLALLPKRRS